MSHSSVGVTKLLGVFRVEGWKWVSGNIGRLAGVIGGGRLTIELDFLIPARPS